MRRLAIVSAAVGALALLQGPALAGKKLHPDKITCKEFVDLDEAVQPEVVYYVIGYNRAGKPEAAAIDTEELVKPLAASVVEDCKKAPTVGLWEKIKSKL